jgi:hypothetical protein
VVSERCQPGIVDHVGVAEEAVVYDAIELVACAIVLAKMRQVTEQVVTSLGVTKVL